MSVAVANAGEFDIVGSSTIEVDFVHFGLHFVLSDDADKIRGGRVDGLATGEWKEKMKQKS